MTEPGVLWLPDRLEIRVQLEHKEREAGWAAAFPAGGNPAEQVKDLIWGVVL
jgi:hypothetical protein